MAGSKVPAFPHATLELSVEPVCLCFCTGKVVKVSRPEGGSLLVSVKFDDGDERLYKLPRDSAELRVAADGKH